MTIWKMKQQIRSEDQFIIEPASMEDLARPDLILIRDADPRDLPEMLRSESRAWPKPSQRATSEILASRIAIFPEGVKIAIRGQEILGIASMLLEDYPWHKHPPGLYARTDNGLIRNHDPMGQTASGTNIGVVPEAPDKVATALIQALVAMAIKKGIPYGLSSPRLPGYHLVKDQMTAREYAWAKDEQGRPRDPVVRMHANMGLELVEVLEDYYPDEESCNCAGIMRLKNPALPYYWETRYNYGAKKPVKHLIFAVPYGCAWSQKSGGCAMCGFQAGANQFKFLAKALDISWADFSGMFDRALLHLQDTVCVNFYTGGSFWELPDYLLTSLMRRVNQIHQVEEVMVETRPEYVTKANLEKVQELVRPELRLKVAIGLESASDRVRGGLINKGFSLSDYVRAVELLLSYGLIPCTYVLLKPPGLGEKEAVSDAIRTINWSAEVGSQQALLQAAFVQEQTRAEAIYRQGAYRPPWLWSILEVLKGHQGKQPVSLGRFDDFPAPIAIPHNCGNCDSELTYLLEQYRMQNLLPYDDLDCSCRQNWLDEDK